MQIRFVVIQSRQINKQKHMKTINLLCAGNKLFVSCQTQGGCLTPKSLLAYALACKTL